MMRELISKIKPKFSKSKKLRLNFFFTKSICARKIPPLQSSRVGSGQHLYFSMCESPEIQDYHRLFKQ